MANYKRHVVKAGTKGTITAWSANNKNVSRVDVKISDENWSSQVETAIDSMQAMSEVKTIKWNNKIIWQR